MSQYIIAHIDHTTKWAEHIHWRKPKSNGYTFCLSRAGLYDLKEAESITESGCCIAVAKADAEKIAKGEPFYRRSNGELARLYDLHAVSVVSVVPNSADAWRHLFHCCIYPGRSKIASTTPIGEKACAIYLSKEGGAT
jgi:hypothetical protein